MSRLIPVPLPDLNKLPSPLEDPKDLTPDDVPQAPGSPTLSSDNANDASNETLLLTSQEKPQSDPLAPLFDVDADKENIPPGETGLLLTAPLTCDEELSKTVATPCLGFEFEQLGVSSSDDEEGESKSDSEEGVGGGDETSSGGEDDEPLVKRPPLVLSAILDHRALKRRISASTLSCTTDLTSEFVKSRCNSPTRSVMRPRSSAGSTLSRIIGRLTLTEDGTQLEQAPSFRDWKEARSETPVGAILPLPLQDTLGIEALLVTESPRPLAHTELSEEASTAVLFALDAAAAPDVNEVKTEETPLAGSSDFPIELLPDPNWGEPGVDRAE